MFYDIHAETIADLLTIDLHVDAFLIVLDAASEQLESDF